MGGWDPRCTFLGVEGTLADDGLVAVGSGRWPLPLNRLGLVSDPRCVRRRPPVLRLSPCLELALVLARRVPDVRHGAVALGAERGAGVRVGDVRAVLPAEAHAEANRALCGMRVEWAAFDEDVELAVEPPRRLGAVVAAGADPCAQVGDESPPRT